MGRQVTFAHSSPSGPGCKPTPGAASKTTLNPSTDTPTSRTRPSPTQTRSGSCTCASARAPGQSVPRGSPVRRRGTTWACSTWRTGETRRSGASRSQRSRLFKDIARARRELDGSKARITLSKDDRTSPRRNHDRVHSFGLVVSQRVCLLLHNVQHEAQPRRQSYAAANCRLRQRREGGHVPGPGRHQRGMRTRLCRRESECPQTRPVGPESLGLNPRRRPSHQTSGPTDLSRDGRRARCRSSAQRYCAAESSADIARDPAGDLEQARCRQATKRAASFHRG